MTGSQASVKCNAGYQLQGNSTLVCQGDGLWSGVQPMCSKQAPPTGNIPCMLLVSLQTALMLGTKKLIQPMKPKMKIYICYITCIIIIIIIIYIYIILVLK